MCKHGQSRYRSIPRELLDLPLEQETRLREAEAALRDCGTKFIAFARTETSALLALRGLGYSQEHPQA
jgi:hypothetical protein